jgi:hypothetical protein
MSSEGMRTDYEKSRLLFNQGRQNVVVVLVHNDALLLIGEACNPYRHRSACVCGALALREVPHTPTEIGKDRQPRCGGAGYPGISRFVAVERNDAGRHVRPVVLSHG